MRKFDNIMLGVWIMLIIVQTILLIYNISRNQQERVYLYGTHQADISFDNQKIDNYEIVEKENGNDLIIHFEKI